MAATAAAAAAARTSSLHSSLWQGLHHHSLKPLQLTLHHCPKPEAIAIASAAWRRPPPLPAQGFASPAASPAIQQLLGSLLQQQGAELDEAQVTALLSARGADMAAVCAAADELRRRACGDDVSYVVNRNINYTNVRPGLQAAEPPASLP
jgi:hypothetical protein